MPVCLSHAQSAASRCQATAPKQDSQETSQGSLFLPSVLPEYRQEQDTAAAGLCFTRSITLHVATGTPCVTSGQPNNAVVYTARLHLCHSQLYEPAHCPCQHTAVALLRLLSVPPP